MEKAKMERISFLSRKQRSEGLTELEKKRTGNSSKRVYRWD